MNRADDRKRVLIVDNDELVLTALEGMLEHEGFDTTTAWGGQEALEKLVSNPFDLVLLDDFLSDVDSEVVLKESQILEDPPPVIVLQTNPMSSEASRLASQGACDVVGKWEARREIAEAVRACLALRAPCKMCS